MAHEEYTRHVKLDDAQREALLNRLNQPHAMGEGVGKRPTGNRRRDTRWDYRHADIAMIVEHPGGGVSRLLVCARNLSSGGMSFLHGGFLHPGSRCKVSLLQTDGKITTHAGTIVSCRHIERTLHEVGVVFDKRIDPAQFSRDPQARATSTSDPAVKLPSLDGCVLYIDPSESDRNLMRFYLESSGAKVKMAADGNEGKALAEKGGYIAIITEVSIPGVGGLELAQALRGAGNKTPLIVVTAEESPELQQRAKDAGCDAVLIKPLDFTNLAAILRQHVPVSIKTADVQPVQSKHWDDQQMRPLIDSFLTSLEDQVQRLRDSVTEGKNDAVRTICLTLKGSASGYGYPTITDAAHSLIKLMDSGSAVDQVKQSLNELVNQCAAAYRGRDAGS